LFCCVLVSVVHLAFIERLRNKVNGQLGFGERGRCSRDYARNRPPQRVSTFP
jgi:hypothetical protein